jgi:ankyrin repeat protein
MSSDLSAAGRLASAVRRNDAAGVARVLAESPELTLHLDEPMPDDAFGATPLLGAVYRGNRQIVEILLHAGADINARSRWWAGSFGVLDHDGPLAALLIERGATVDVHAASRRGMLDTLEALVPADPGLVNARGGDGQTPLHVAASVPVARYLLDHGADIDARDIDHESTPAQYLIRDHPDVARYLVERGCRTDILLAAALGDLERVARHLDADPDAIRTAVTEKFFPKQDPRSGGHIYNWTLGSGKTAHAVAREFGHDGAFELLMARSPETLKLAVTCEIGDEPAVQALLARNPSLAGTLTPDEQRKLPDAARDDNGTALRLMLTAGWPIDARGQHGGTALHWAAWNGNAALTRDLLRHRPSLELTDHDHGGTPLGWAVYGSVHGWRCKTGDYAGTVALLLEAGAQPPTVTTDSEVSDAVRAVLQRGRSTGK